MNYFLMLVILAVCGGAYYEYTAQQEIILTDQQQISDLTNKTTSLQSENKKLTDDQTQIIENLADAQKKVANLTEQLKNAAKTGVVAPVSANPAPPVTYASLPGIPTPNNLGTIITQDGRAFQNCQLLAVEADGITFNHTLGITKVLFPFLPHDLQKRFGYDFQKDVAQTKAEVQYQEEKRKAAAAVSADGK